MKELEEGGLYKREGRRKELLRKEKGIKPGKGGSRREAELKLRNRLIQGGETNRAGKEETVPRGKGSWIKGKSGLRERKKVFSRKGKMVAKRKPSRRRMLAEERRLTGEKKIPLFRGDLGQQFAPATKKSLRTKEGPLYRGCKRNRATGRSRPKRRINSGKGRNIEREKTSPVRSLEKGERKISLPEKCGEEGADSDLQGVLFSRGTS